MIRREDPSTRGTRKRAVEKIPRYDPSKKDPPKKVPPIKVPRKLLPREGPSIWVRLKKGPTIMVSHRKVNRKSVNPGRVKRPRRL
jgi:hypothetical protein